MGFIESVTTVFSKFATFRGRASRSEFWWFILFYLIVSTALAGVFGGWLLALFDLVLVVPCIALTTRRLHDIGKSGWWQLLEFAPVPHIWAVSALPESMLLLKFSPLLTAAFCWLTLLFWFVKASDPFSNAYDEKPAYSRMQRATR
jgi:uncharacterized membrane protein YhaH (DUF805 family)